MVSVRQWVLSFPFEIRYRLAWDGELVSTVLAVFLRVVNGWYRRQAKAMGHAGGRSGSVTFVQRFRSSVNLNVHLHVLALDGVYVRDADGSPSFVPAPRLTDEDVRRIVETTAKRVLRLCHRQGIFEEGAVDPFWDQEPLLTLIRAPKRRSQHRRNVMSPASMQRAYSRLAKAHQTHHNGPLSFLSVRGLPRVALDRWGLQRGTPDRVRLLGRRAVG